MKTVVEIIVELSEYPSEAIAYAYSGEVIGIVIVEPVTRRELGVIETSES